MGLPRASPLLATASVALLSASAGGADLSETVARGARVRVHPVSGNATTVGLFLDHPIDLILLRSLDTADTLAVSVAGIERLEVSRERRTRALEGNVLGVLAGALGGAIWSNAISDDTAAGVAIGAGIGCLLGTIVGVSIHVDRWVELPRDTYTNAACSRDLLRLGLGTSW